MLGKRSGKTDLKNTHATTKRLYDEDASANEIWNHFTSALEDSISKIFLGFCFNFAGILFTSVYTMSWSDKPGITSVLLKLSG
jgi:hypothetical protein